MRRISRHGTTSMYAKYGCRCDLCVKAYRAYQRAWRAKNPTYHPEYQKFYRSLGGSEGAKNIDKISRH